MSRSLLLSAAINAERLRGELMGFYVKRVEWCASYRRALRSRILSKPRLISVKRASILGSNSQSVKM